MSDLIERQAVMLRVREFIGNPTYNETMLVNDLNALPTAEPERKKGYWTEDSDPGQIIGEHYSCSECRVCFGTLKSNFCPHCGADMRGKQ